MKRQSPMLIFIAILALIQGVLGVFRAFEWFNVGADLLGQGLLILPLVGVVAFARGGLVIVLAMLYALFAVGMVLQKSWAWWLGLIVAAISILLVLNVVIQGESVSRAGLWLIAPIIIAVYLLSRSGRAAATRRMEVNF
jgi:phosphoglycerol transferase MdoB-like AlkP superfamily enzyme